MAIKQLIVILLALQAYSLYTSQDWLIKGYDVRDGKLSEEENYQLNIDTSCADITLDKPPNVYNGTVMSGYLKVGKGGSALSFLFYGKEKVARADLNKVPIVLWLNGGPGSSSQLGNFMELGPLWIKQNPMTPYEIIANNQSWTKDYNVIFVDQPVGTGLSYADPTYPNVYCKSMTDVANDFYVALEQLYTNPNGCFSRLNFKTDQPLFIFGQSYAGKYAPAIADKIMRELKTGKNFVLPGLKGVAVGDGFTHPEDTLSMMGEFAYNLGLIDYQERTKVEQIILNSTYQHRSKAWRALHDSFERVLEIIKTSTGGVNVYDITKYRDYPTKLIDEYLERPDIISLYGLNAGVRFGSQSANVYEALFEDFMKEYTDLVSGLLEGGMRVLIYSGQNDLIVETPGTFRWVERMHFAQAEMFRDKLLAPWKVEGKMAGFFKSVGNLELRTINNAGHLVPMDQPVVARQMLNEFVKKCLGDI